MFWTCDDNDGDDDDDDGDGVMKMKAMKVVIMTNLHIIVAAYDCGYYNASLILRNNKVLTKVMKAKR